MKVDRTRKYIIQHLVPPFIWFVEDKEDVIMEEAEAEVETPADPTQTPAASTVSKKKKKRNRRKAKSQDAAAMECDGS